MQEYKLTIKRKNVKNISIRVLSFDEVLLTLPIFASKKRALEFVKSKESWIQKALQNQEKPFVLEDGAKIFYLGKPYTIALYHDRKQRVELVEEFFHIYYKDDKEKVLEKFLKKEAKEIFSKLIQKWEEKLDKKVERVSIKKMKTRWGSCNTQKRYINLNLKLIHKDIDVIEYIILHEMAHLTYPNHSKSFHDYVTKYMPDWKLRDKKLKNVV
jgi:predicted metal-dependent hydrolase